MAAFKEMFNPEAVRKLAGWISGSWKGFLSDEFADWVIPGLASRELKARGILITEGLEKFLPGDFKKASSILVKALPAPLISEDLSQGEGGFILMPMTAFIARNGMDHFEESMQALYQMTRRFTAEFDIRPFILQYPQKTMDLLHHWASDPDLHIRRLVSEGSRPRLPWGIRLRPFVENPEPVIELLQKLNADPSLYVRRSVANNLNDIAKDHPDRVIEVLQEWKKEGHKGTDWIIGHASRSLIKEGHPDALVLLGFDPKVKISAKFIRVKPNSLPWSGILEFECEVTSLEKKPVNLMIDYRIHFVRKNGKTNPKVFKWAKRTINPGETIHLTGKNNFRPVSTRAYYPGMHKVEIQINGKIMDAGEFELMAGK